MRGSARALAALAALAVLALHGAPVVLGAKTKKGGAGKGAAKGGDLKAKLAAKDAEAALEKRDVQTAIAKLLVATQADPGYSDYYTQLASAYRSAGMKMEAAKAYETSISMMDEPRNKAGGDQYWAAVHVNLGYVYAEGGGAGLYPGAMQKAADVFREATKLLPDFAEAYTYWGNALQEMGQMEQAAKVFQDAIGKFVKGKGKGKGKLQQDASMPAEKAAMLFFHLANCQGALGDTNGALKAYKEATKVNGAFAAAYTNMGTIYQGRKQNDLAKDALTKAVQIDGQLAEAYTNLGIALQDLGEGEDAERMTGLAVKLKPDLAAGHNNHGRALENNNKLEAALKSYKKALQHSGQQGYADAFCAKVYLEHFLCAWDTLDADMLQVSSSLEQNLLPQHAAAEPCVQPFRAFAYPLPPGLFHNVTIKIVEQERVRLPTGPKAGASSEAAKLLYHTSSHAPPLNGRTPRRSCRPCRAEAARHGAHSLRTVRTPPRPPRLLGSADVLLPRACGRCVQALVGGAGAAAACGARWRAPAAGGLHVFRLWGPYRRLADPQPAQAAQS